MVKLTDDTTTTRTEHGYDQLLVFALPYPPGRVWSALTHRRGIEAWLGHFVEHSGSHLRVIPDGADDEVRIEIEQCRKPDDLEVRWVSPTEGATELCCRLQHAPGGCEMRIRQEHLANKETAARYAERWRTTVARLVGFLDQS